MFFTKNPFGEDKGLNFRVWDDGIWSKWTFLAIFWLFLAIFLRQQYRKFQNRPKMHKITSCELLMVGNGVLSEFGLHWRRFWAFLGDFWKISKIDIGKIWIFWWFWLNFSNIKSSDVGGVIVHIQRLKIPKIEFNVEYSHLERHIWPLEGHYMWFYALLGDFEMFDFVVSGECLKIPKRWAKILILAKFCHLKHDILDIYPRQKDF